jgi:hypothetical protein
VFRLHVEREPAEGGEYLVGRTIREQDDAGHDSRGYRLGMSDGTLDLR